MKLAKTTFLVFSLLALPVWADGPQTGTIDGHVRDAQGAGLPGVTVTLKGPQNEQSTTTGVRRAVDLEPAGDTAETITVVSEAAIISKYETAEPR